MKYDTEAYIYENSLSKLTVWQRVVWGWLRFKGHVRQFIYNTLILLIRMLEGLNSRHAHLCGMLLKRVTGNTSIPLG